MKKNPFKIEKGVSLLQARSYNIETLQFLVDALSKLKAKMNESVYIPNDILNRERAFYYVKRARIIVNRKTECTGAKFKMRIHKENDVYLGARVFRVS